MGSAVMELQRNEGEGLRGTAVKIAPKCFFILDSSLLCFLKLLLVTILNNVEAKTDLTHHSPAGWLPLETLCYLPLCWAH